MRVAVIVPSYNEEEKIQATIKSLNTALPQAEIIVVDDGSRDSTGSLAVANGATVISHKFNLGKAEAVATGLGSCRAEVIALVDGDMGASAGEILPLVEAVSQGKCEMAIGRFRISQGGGLGLVRNLATWGIFILTGKKLRAPLSGQRAVTRDLLHNCLPAKGGFGLETELTLNALQKGYRVEEYLTGFVHRGTGWSFQGVRHRGRQFFHVTGALARGAWRWRQQ